MHPPSPRWAWVYMQANSGTHRGSLWPVVLFFGDPAPQGSLTTLGSPCAEIAFPKTFAKAAGGINCLFYAERKSA